MGMDGGGVNVLGIVEDNGGIDQEIKNFCFYQVLDIGGNEKFQWYMVKILGFLGEFEGFDYFKINQG